MRKGKLNPKELQSLIFNNLSQRRKEVYLHASLGEDCAAIECKSKYMLITTDPITTKCHNPGQLAIHINANDIASSGGEPIAVTLTIIAPVNASDNDIKSIMIESEKEASKLNIEIVGGHTEFSDLVNRIFVSCTMLGMVDKPISSITSKIGDSIIMTKYAAIEGTLILSENLEDIKKEFNDELEWMNNNLSVLPEGQLMSSLNISAMHDVTESGVFGAITEILEANNLGAIINVKDIPLMDVTKRVVEKLNINPYKLISSGSMIITTSNPEKVISKLNDNNIIATVIGRVNNSSEIIADYGDYQEKVYVESDEINKVGELGE